VVVGRGTVERDDPRLLGVARPDRSPSRIVLDSRLSIDPDCRLARLWRRQWGRIAVEDATVTGNWIRDARSRSRRWRRRPRLIAATAEPSRRRIDRFRRRGWEIWPLPGRDGRVDLAALAQHAASEGLIDLLIEPGPVLMGAFLNLGPIDRILTFVAPKVLGGPNGWSDLSEPRMLGRALEPVAAGPVREIGGDFLFEWTGKLGAAIVPPRATADRLHSS
jgi:diaminohydroxyphosphoribosylaminopyrimidine deaminase/5-amino-6-(5-phosphoribosylamino)uracil reductase